MQSLTRYRYLALFATLLALLLIFPALHGPRRSIFVANVLLTFMYVAGTVVLLYQPGYRIPKLFIVVPATLGAWFGYEIPGTEPWFASVLFHLAGLLFQVSLLWVVLRAAYRERTVTADAIFAAMCGYLILGTAFGHLYCMREAITPGSFRGDAWTGDSGDVHILLTYFSFITLSTVGYGDILPLTRETRSLAVLEAITGQFYIAVLVADLIGKRVAQSMTESEQRP